MAGTGIIIGTIFFTLLGIAGCVISVVQINKHVRDRRTKAENKNLAYVVVTMAAFCMWLHWVCAYMHQLHPITPPTPEVESH